MQPFVFDNYASLPYPVPLPYFEGDIRQADRPADAYEMLGHHYDGRTNKVEIRPLLKAPGCRFGVYLPSGESYTIGERHLTRLILSARPQTLESPCHAAS